MHNGQLADPTNPIAIEMAKLTKRKNDMTIAQREQLAKLEWMGGIYLSNNRPCLPSSMLEANIIVGAKKSKKGKAALGGIQVKEDAILKYDGPDDLDKLWNDPKFHLTTQVNIKKNKITRTRPKFDKWSTTIIIDYNDELVNKDEVADWLKAGGEAGYGDYRPKFGRYHVISIDGVKI